MCVCKPGYEGEFCTQDRDECLDKDICGDQGTCENLAGGFVCACQPGFSGKFCQDRVNMCENYGCKNGGECAHTPDQQPVCYCPQGFIGHKCEQKCSSGFGGYNCSLPLDQPHCSRTRGKCYNEGKCMLGFCKCPPQFIGDRCEFNRTSGYLPEVKTSCEYNPCMNNGECVDVSDGYACICPPGFFGPDCDWKLQCATTTCANGGQCRNEKSGLKCECPLGFSGEYCENRESFDCSQKPCLNGGTCNSAGSCDCPYGFTGATCQEKLVFEEKKEILVRNLCVKRECDSKASNGICNPECNLEECKFDGGDCSGGQQPFSKCLYPSRCADLFANGICNQECNNEGCLYDGLDCQSELYRCPKDIRDYCIKKRGDGECDHACSFVGCGFDGGDCYNRTGAMILNDIRIVIQIDPIVFHATGGDTLMEISRHLRAAVRIQKDEIGPLVFNWDGENESERLEMDTDRLNEQQVLSRHVRRYRSAEITGVVLYLEVEEICQPLSTCRFSSAQTIVNLISAGLIKSDGRQSLGLPITEAMVATPRRHSEGGWSRSQMLFIAVVAFLALGTVVAGVMVTSGEAERSRKRKIIHAPVWMPPMDNSIDKLRHNSSVYSSQCSLLNSNNNMYYNEAKRQRGDYGYEEHYQEIYPTTLANGVTGEFAAGVSPPLYQHNSFPADAVTDLPAVNIPLHVQAAGPEPITEVITRENVHQSDSNYRRQVLHWIAGNTHGKTEEQIVKEAEQCLNAGADVNARDCDENTPLMLAVKSRRVRLAVVLMRRGANPTIFNKAERSTLHEAAVNKDLRMMTNLLTDARMVREIDELDRTGMTALMQTAGSFGGQQVEMACLLLNHGAKIDADGSSRRDSDRFHGRTALHYAALCDNIEMVEFLISRNSNTDKQDEAGMTPIMLAARERNVRTVQFLLLHGASLTAVDALDKTAARFAKDAFDKATVDFLMKMSNDRVRNEAVRQYNMTNGSSVKYTRQTMKTVKKLGSRKMPILSTPPSRESNHLTPPPSDGSFSSPSPNYFQTSSSTPTGMESSPEYTHNQDMKYIPTTPWQSISHPYYNNPNRTVPANPNTGINSGDKLPDGSLYC